MAGDRHGKHNTTTISFRVNSYEKATIEERVKVSGMKKQDYIVRSCIYNQVCVVGKKETIEIIRSEMKEMNLVLEDVAKDLKSEKPVISEPVLDVPIQYQQYPFSQVEEEYRNLFNQLSVKICK